MGGPNPTRGVDWGGMCELLAQKILFNLGKKTYGKGQIFLLKILEVLAQKTPELLNYGGGVWLMYIWKLTPQTIWALIPRLDLIFRFNLPPIKKTQF